MRGRLNGGCGSVAEIGGVWGGGTMKGRGKQMSDAIHSIDGNRAGRQFGRKT